MLDLCLMLVFTVQGIRTRREELDLKLAQVAETQASQAAAEVKLIERERALDAKSKEVSEAEARQRTRDADTRRQLSDIAQARERLRAVEEVCVVLSIVLARPVRVVNPVPLVLRCYNV
jgi:hypothetical protein